MTRVQRPSRPAAPAALRPRLSVGFVLAPRFTLLAFSAFIDALRLAADDGDRSRPVDCRWEVLSHDLQPITASCGIKVAPTSELPDPAAFDYLVVVGGLLPHLKLDARLNAYLRGYAAASKPLVGICTGSFVLARLGLMAGRRSCVSWYVASDFVAEFPSLEVDSGELFIDDGDRLTCAGGTSVVHLAAHLIERHCDKARAAKALRIMIEHAQLPSHSAQPVPLVVREAADVRVHKAVLLIERHISTPVTAEFIAQHVELSVRHLERLFQSELGMGPVAFASRLRMQTAYGLLVSTDAPILNIAMECGFMSNSHFSRCFKQAYGKSPTQVRDEHRRSLAAA